MNGTGSLNNVEVVGEKKAQTMLFCVMPGLQDNEQSTGESELPRGRFDMPPYGKAERVIVEQSEK